MRMLVFSVKYSKRYYSVETSDRDEISLRSNSYSGYVKFRQKDQIVDL